MWRGEKTTRFDASPILVALKKPKSALYILIDFSDKNNLNIALNDIMLTTS